MKLSDLKCVYGELAPVMHVKPSDTMETSTVDADGKALEAAGMKPKGANPLTGPFYIDGAEPGDTLVVRFLKLEMDGQQGWGGAGPGFGALNSSHYTPVLGKGIPVTSWTYEIDKAANVATFQAHDSRFSV